MAKGKNDDSQPLFKMEWLFQNPWGEKNPLVTLGFTAEDARELRRRPEIVDQAISLMHRLKMLMYHPDQVPYRHRYAMELNTAREHCANEFFRGAIIEECVSGKDPQHQLREAQAELDRLRLQVVEQERTIAKLRGSETEIPEIHLALLEQRLRAYAVQSCPTLKNLTVRAQGDYAEIYRAPDQRDHPLFRLKYLGKGERWDVVLRSGSPEICLDHYLSSSTL